MVGKFLELNWGHLDRNIFIINVELKQTLFIL